MTPDTPPGTGGRRARAARAVGIVALTGTIVPPTLTMLGMLAEQPMRHIMLAAALAWFAAAPFWMDVD